MNIREKIVSFIENENYEKMTREELAHVFEIDMHDRKFFYKVLKDLEKEARILRDKEDRYSKLDPETMLVGKIDGSEKGYAFLIPEDDGEEDVFIPREKMHDALDGDEVLINIVKTDESRRSREGSVLRILKRNTKRIVGSFQDNGNFAFVIPNNKKFAYDIFIPKKYYLKAKDKQKVEVEIIKYPKDGKNPEGRVVDVLGYMFDKGVDIKSVIKEYDFPTIFPKKVKDEAKRVSINLDDEDLSSRKDLRDHLTFTIDGFDAKDLDDAISIERLNNGNYKLGVHIADVGHYVKPNSELDKEALLRGNSIYLLDLVIPMLPEELSNGICSLNPGEDRLALSVIMEISENGDLVKHEIIESIINSKRRLVYDVVSDFLEESIIDESIIGLEDELFLMENLAKTLKEKRENKGALDFDFPETKIILDENGRPTDVFKEDRRIANKIIEEFMLVTNETIAEHFYWTELPFIYRIHEEPAEEKINEFKSYIRSLGFYIKGSDIHPRELQKLLNEVKGKGEEFLVNNLMLRSLKKAVYSESQGIHFGLASDYYTHFTAPIRRYSDLYIHRIIKFYLNGKLDNKLVNKLETKTFEIADHVSKTERKAEEAEREIMDMKKAEYMLRFIGCEFTGRIVSITNFGIFIALDNTIEGLVHFSTMDDDYYVFDEDNYLVIGERHRKVYRLGQEVDVLILDASPERGTIDFKIV